MRPTGRTAAVGPHEPGVSLHDAGGRLELQAPFPPVESLLSFAARLDAPEAEDDPVPPLGCPPARVPGCGPSVCGAPLQGSSSPAPWREEPPKGEHDEQRMPGPLPSPDAEPYSSLAPHAPPPTLQDPPPPTLHAPPPPSHDSPHCRAQGPSPTVMHTATMSPFRSDFT